MSEKDPKNSQDGLNLFSAKAAFVAGIVLIISIITDALELCIAIPYWVVLCYSFGVLLLFWLFLGTDKFDERLKTKQVNNFGIFLTVASVIMFLLEKFILGAKGTVVENLGIFEIIAIGFFVVFGLIVIVLALYLLFAKY